MTWLDKFLFLSIGLGSILYFMLKRLMNGYSYGSGNADDSGDYYVTG